MKSINILEKFTHINSYWHPHQVATVNDMQVILARIKGEFVWHKHEEEDELFQVIRGTLFMQFRDRTEVVQEGEFIVVPRGLEHCPATAEGEEVLLMLFERTSTSHTGNVQHELTKTEYPKI